MTLTSLTTAINSILGFRDQRIGFPDGRYYNECTAVVAHLHGQLGIPVPSMFGARADGWGVSFPAELAPYYDHEAFQSGKAYPYGTLLLWNSPHIAIVLSHDGGKTVQVFEQNADPNGAACQVYSRVINNKFHACSYALIPKLEQPAPAPLWTTSPENRLVKVKPGSRKWNLAQASFESVANNPITTAGDNEVFTATAILHHRNIPQYNYYLEDANTPHGWNVLDCLDYTLPPPPITPPAAPVPVPRAERYTLVTFVMTFHSALDAQMKSNYSGDLEPGTYFVWDSQENSKLLGTDNMKRPDPETWVNIKDNVVAAPQPIVQPEPTPAVTITPVTVSASPEQPVDTKPKPQYHWLNENDRLPYRYKSTNSIPVPMTILEGNLRPQPVPAYWEGDFSMYTVVKDRLGNDITYLLPDKTRKSGWMYGIPETMLEEVTPGLDLNHNGISDGVEIAASWDKFADIIPRWVNKTAPIIVPKVKLATKQGRQVIDGFISVKKRKDKIQ